MRLPFSPDCHTLANHCGGRVRLELVGERFRDDGHHLGTGAVVIGEAAPDQERDAHGVQITVTDTCRVDDDDSRGAVLVHLQRDPRAAGSEIQRQAIGHCGGRDTARLCEIVAGASGSERDSLVCDIVERQWRRVQHVGCESEIACRGDTDEIERDGAQDDQRHRDGHLQRSGEAMNASRLDPADAGIILQRRDDHRTTETGRRQESEDHAGRQA